MTLWLRLPRPPDADLDRLTHPAWREARHAGKSAHPLRVTMCRTTPAPGGCVAASRWGFAGHTPRASVVRKLECDLPLVLQED